MLLTCSNNELQKKIDRLVDTEDEDELLELDNLYVI